MTLFMSGRLPRRPAPRAVNPYANAVFVVIVSATLGVATVCLVSLVSAYG
jgi:hypothetical protein